MPISGPQAQSRHRRRIKAADKGDMGCQGIRCKRNNTITCVFLAQRRGGRDAAPKGVALA